MDAQVLFTEEAKRVAKAVREASRISIFTHIDADGITSGSIAYETARRLSIPVEIGFLKKLDDRAIELVRSKADSLVWMNDLGSGYLSRFSGMNMVIADHHEPEIENPITLDNGRYKLAESTIYHLNAHLFGIEGSTEVSSSTTAFFISRAVDSRNRDMAAISLVGAVGDLQDSRYGRLTGLNRIVLDEAVSAGSVRIVRDARFYGKETRPLSKLLEYSVDPPIPGISSEPGASARMLDSLGVDYRDGGRERTWNEISADDRRKILSFIVQSLIADNAPPEQINAIVGETYLITDPRAEEDMRMPRDAKEFATLINACGRYEKYSTGLELCMGVRGKVLDDALALLQEHRRNVANTIRMVKVEGLNQMGSLQYFHTRDRAPDSIVGTIAGIMMKSREVDETKVVVGFAYSEGKVKVSCRGNAELVQNGLNLSDAVRTAAERVGGVGGGHSIAAGATIDVGREEAFLLELDAVLSQQLMSGSSHASVPDKPE
jgi:single-stranded-DNA-specific exonuclease